MPDPLSNNNSNFTNVLMITAEQSRRWWVILLLLSVGLAAACASSTNSGEEEGEESEEETSTYELSVSADPETGGNVDPENGTYSQGEEVEVTATAAEGWSFVEWTGDQASAQNPLTFSISANTDITANFEEQATAYSEEIEVDDGANANTIIFGMKEDATAAYDRDLEDEAPPRPPQGSFFGFFVIEGHNLYQDFRPVQADRTVWEINFGTSSERSISLRWDLSSSTYYGSLTLVDDPDNPSLEIDMSAEMSYEVTDNEIDELYIIQE
jgi:hypothetical protein